MPRRRKADANDPDLSRDSVKIDVSLEMLLQALAFVGQCMPFLPESKLEVMAAELEKMHGVATSSTTESEGQMPLRKRRIINLDSDKATHMVCIGVSRSVFDNCWTIVKEYILNTSHHERSAFAEDLSNFNDQIQELIKSLTQ